MYVITGFCFNFRQDNFTPPLLYFITRFFPCFAREKSNAVINVVVIVPISLTLGVELIVPVRVQRIYLKKYIPLLTRPGPLTYGKNLVQLLV